MTVWYAIIMLHLGKSIQRASSLSSVLQDNRLDCLPTNLSFGVLDKLNYVDDIPLWNHFKEIKHGIVENEQTNKHMIEIVEELP